jgi:predicted aspartyl protease/Flp pilus assembly protein TadD
VLVAVALAAAAPLFLDAEATRLSHHADIQLQFGDLLYSEGRYREALDAYQRADLRAEGLLKVRAKAGLVRTALRVAEFDLAGEHAALLRRLAPRDPDVLSLYADALWSAGLFDEAEQLHLEVLTANPRLARSHVGLARALVGRNRLDVAFEEAQAAVRLAPGDPEPHFILGGLYQRRRQLREAISSYTNYINLLPNKDASPMATWARTEIQFLRSFGDTVPLKMDPASATERHTVPFELVHDKIIVKARVNRLEEVDFVLDTGAEHTVLSARTARRLGISAIVTTISAGVGDAGLRGLEVGRLDSLEIGTFKVENVRCIIKNPALTGLPSAESESLSPLALGMSATIDYQRRQLVFGRDLPAEPSDVELPLRMNRLATVRGTVNENRHTNFVVDTGGEVLSISAATARSLLVPPRPVRIKLKVYGTSGWDPEAYLLPGVDLSFDQIRFPNVPVVVLDLRGPSALVGYQIGGIIGHSFLSRYRVGIDLQRSVLRLTKS